MDVKKDILWRVYLAFIGMVLLGICVLAKAFYVQRAEGKYWISKSDSSYIKTRIIEPGRGSIYSEDGNILSTSVPVFDVFIDFGAEGLRAKKGKRFSDNIDSLSLSLAQLFKDKSKLEYERELKLAYKLKDRYYPLKKKISFAQYDALRDFPLVRQGKNKSGFIIEDHDKRINPYILLANRTIGISRPNKKANVGLELTYDSLLRGTPGQKLMRFSAGTFIPVEGSELDPVNGKDIVTTLDTYMQDIAQNALMRMMVGNNSMHGTAIVMETATGKIKAIANLGKQPDGSYIEDLNYGIGKATEPGSVFKLATLLSLLEDGYVSNESIVDCEGGQMFFSGLRIKDSHLGAGKMTVKEAFLRSSNVAFAKLANEAYQNNSKKFTDNLARFGLTTATGVDIVAASGMPFIKTQAKNKSWGKTTIPFMAHGYEEMVTPLHMLMLYNAIANDGKLMRPYLMSAVQDYGVTVLQIQPQVINNQIASAETIRQAKECLKAVVDSLHGTGHKILFDSAYSISGKTGTAVSAIGNKGYNKGNKIYQSSFIGYFPSEKPMYSMAVVIQNSRESKKYYGADVAGNVFKEIADRIYGHFINDTRYDKKLQQDSVVLAATGNAQDMDVILKFLSVKLKQNPTSTYWKLVNIYHQAASEQKINYADAASKQMPAVLGMGLKDAVYLLENKGLQVSFIGRGKVISQNVPEGASVRKGEKVQIVLN